MSRFARVVIWLGLLLLGASGALAADASPPVGCIVVFLPQGIDWLTLHCDSQDLSAARSEFATQLFQSRDLDHDGTLNENEASQLLSWSPTLNRLQLLGNQWKRADTAPADGKLTSEEWRKFVEESFGPALRITIDTQGVRRAGVLFSLIDQNGDGRLTSAELVQGSARMLRCDFDDDELISLSELTELRPAAETGSKAATLETEPFLLLNGEDSIALALREIEARYGQPSDAGVPVTRIAGDVASFDKDADGFLDSLELKQVLLAPPTTGQLQIALKDSKSGVRWIEPGSDDAPLTPRRKDRVEMANLTFDARFISTTLIDQLRRQELKSQFGEADKDNNDYLSAAEFAEFVSVLDANIAPDPAMADLDGNNQITLAEVTLFNELRELASRCQLQLTVRREMLSLFNALDQDKNQGVSGWEIQAGPAQMAALDLNQDGSVAASELSGELTLFIGFASPRRDETTLPAVRSPAKKPPTRTASQGPAWFQRMDRNQDRRVSWREFLGTREQFQTLDKNKDGSIAAAEAL